MLVLATAGVAVYLAVTRSLETEFDQDLDQRVRGFASLLFQPGEDVEFEFSDQLMPEYQRAELPAYFELWYADGRVLERSESLRGQDLSVAGASSSAPMHWTAALPDGRPGRYVAELIEVHHVYPEEGPDRPTAATILVSVASGREELVAARRTILVQCVVVALTLMLLIGFFAWTAVARGLEPANRLAAALDAIEIDRLPERLDLGELPAELEPVSRKTDALIRRVDQALERERRTAADIAHELRTPISELLTVSEVALNDGQDAANTRRALGTVRDVAWRMGRAVSTLLALARLEMGVESEGCASVDLEEVMRESLLSLSSLERERELRVENHIEAGQRIEGHPDVVRIVIANLLSNALYYAPPRGVVQCRLERTSERWRFVVENDAGALRKEDLRALSEPFWRKDRARSDRNRSGLGLALSRALAEKTGMELTFELEDGTFRAILGGWERRAVEEVGNAAGSTRRERQP